MIFLKFSWPKSGEREKNGNKETLARKKQNEVKLNDEAGEINEGTPKATVQAVLFPNGWCHLAVLRRANEWNFKNPTIGQGGVAIPRSAGFKGMH